MSRRDSIVSTLFGDRDFLTQSELDHFNDPKSDCASKGPLNGEPAVSMTAMDVRMSSTEDFDSSPKQQGRNQQESFKESPVKSNISVGLV